MTTDELKNILIEHKKWLDCELGSRADLRSADLSRADLRSADLSRANLRSADLSDADLSGADLSGADLKDVNLRGATLRSADLRGADLNGADLSGIFINECTIGITNLCPSEGSFIGWKKCIDNTLVKLLILASAKRSNATTLKCRCSEAKVMAIYDENENELQKTFSIHDNSFKYEIGKIIKVANFDEDRWNECSIGIHFFIDKESARQYS
jgi:uncharacterized protein YjbI with pentapeptide repeats